jgi:hypothetical protein
MLADYLRIAVTFGLVGAVLGSCWWVLRDRRGAVPIAVGCTLGYLVFGNLLSRVLLLDVIFPADWAGRSGGEVQTLLWVHTVVTMGTAAVTALGVAVGLKQVLQPAPE